MLMLNDRKKSDKLKVKHYRILVANFIFFWTLFNHHVVIHVLNVIVFVKFFE